MALTTYADKYAATQDTDLRKQVSIAVALAADYILGGGSLNNKGHETNAENAIKSPPLFVDQFIWFVVTDSMVASNYPAQTDAQVRAVIDAKWPRLWK
jgi:hypothetical protein